MWRNLFTIAIFLLYKVSTADGTTAAAVAAYDDALGNNVATPTGLRGANTDAQDVHFWPQKNDETSRSLHSLRNDDDEIPIL